MTMILNQLIDCLLNELSARFHNDSTDMPESLNDAGKLFHISLTELELSVFLQHAVRKRAFKSLTDVMDNEDVFSHVHFSLKAAIFLLMTSCIKCVFNVWRVKTASQSYLLTNYLNSSCLLTFEILQQLSTMMKLFIYSKANPVNYSQTDVR